MINKLVSPNLEAFDVDLITNLDSVPLLLIPHFFFNIKQVLESVQHSTCDDV